ncbi:MAG: thiamine pyrophosphate-binding protein [Thermoleophilia bacterium]
MDGAAWLLEALAAEGITRLFGNPGSTELPITDALGRQDRVEYVLALHEAAAMGMADGHAQVTGRPAAVNVHVQPGLANAMSGILNAARARVPLLVTVGQQVQAMLPGAPFLGGELVGMAEPLAKGAWEVERAADLPEALSRALALAAAPPAGPVVLSLPLDVQVAPAPPAHRPAPPPAPATPDPAALDAAAALLRDARAPLVVAGDEVARAGDGAGRDLAALAERLGAPLHGEPMGARVPLRTDHDLWRGPLPPFAAQIAPVLAPHDVVLAVGMPVFRLFGTSPGPAIPDGVALVHLDADPAEIGRSHAPAVGAAGDVGAALAGLLDRLGPAGPEVAARAAAAREATLAGRRAARERVEAATGAARIGPAEIALAVAGAVGEADVVVDEALTSGRALRAVAGPRTPATWFAHRGSALGWGLPAAVGAAIADPSRRVLALQGDGGFVFGAPALWTAASRGTPLALLVADNGGYEILRAGLEGLTGRPTGEWPGIALDSPRLDVGAIASGFGASVAHVAAPGDLPAALDDLWRRAADGPAVLVAAVEGRTAPVGYPVEPGSA